ncbi:DUF1611 domain-containing protein [uncultured Nitrosomonas sp.]|uniref:DUF1611 domain-containing protein n=1 Tax=uncultured Nitrosomonas sp. TaxID=156424 RepID=UPI0025D82165|nr:DUF1611 domain-containing protein [uncultured Nitrosomonas sp.]
MPTQLQDMFKKAKWSFSTRRVDHAQAQALDADFSVTHPGDLILGRVLSIGQHQRIQLLAGRPSTLYPGDLVVLPCGARYASDQFEGIAKIDPEGCDMLAGGGCLGRMLRRNARIKAPTRIKPLGRIMNVDGQALNVADFALPRAAGRSTLPVIAVLGTAMNSGKTTATVALSHGLTRAGYRVATIKATGTGAFGDYNNYVDAGAHVVADFTDAGMVTTYLEPLERIKRGINDLLWHGQQSGAGIAVMEIADGLFQKETAALIADEVFHKRVTGVMFACGDALAAAGGVAELARLGLKPVALTGMLSCSPMASAEAQAATGIEVVTRNQLLDPVKASQLAAMLGAIYEVSAA